RLALQRCEAIAKNAATMYKGLKGTCVLSRLLLFLLLVNVAFTPDIITLFGATTKSIHKTMSKARKQLTVAKALGILQMVRARPDVKHEKRPISRVRYFTHTAKYCLRSRVIDSVCCRTFSTCSRRVWRVESMARLCAVAIDAVIRFWCASSFI